MASDPSLTLLFEIGVLIVLASLASEVFKRLRLPGLIGAILVGLIIGGPGGVGLVTDLAVVAILATLGSVLLVFVVGLEFDVSQFLRVGWRAFWLTTAGVLASVILGYGLGLALGWSPPAALLLGAILAPSGTSVIASIVQGEGKTDSRAGTTILTAAILDDVEGIVVLSVALGVAVRGRVEATDLVVSTVTASLFVLVAIYLGGRFFPRIVTRFERAVSDETFFAILLGAGLLLAFLATQVGLAAITGAFIMGAIVPVGKIGAKLSHRLGLMRDIFAAIFFTSIGLSIDPRLLPPLLPTALLVLGGAIGARFLGGMVAGRLSGFHGRPLAFLAFGLAVRAELSLIVAREGVRAGIVNSEFLGLAALVVIGSIIIMLPVVTRLARTV